jgi:ABC-2 type transport system ATP-binding protein
MKTLELDGLSKSYGRVQALRSVSFDVRAGEIFGFVGSNGAGKTTAMRIVLGVLTPDAGAVRWDGAPVDLATRRRIGYMPEERGLYPRMKVGVQLVYLGRLHGLSRGDAQAAMERWTERLGIAGRRGDDVQKLSLGNQQRVQLTAALMHDPDILVLDEPFSGLDPVAVDVMSDVLRERAAAGVPVVFSSHQLALVEGLCDRVGIIQDGSMVAVGSIAELRSREGERRWVIDAPAAPQGWQEAVPGLSTVEVDGPRVTFELTGAPPGAEQAVLLAALRTGPVREFGPVRPTLTDLYRDVVRQDEGRLQAPVPGHDQAAGRRAGGRRLGGRPGGRRPGGRWAGKDRA